MKKKIAILCGGMSSEYEISMLSGKNVFEGISRKTYHPTLVEITKTGQWLKWDDKNKRTPLKVFDAEGKHVQSDLKQFDIIFVTLHGKYGEDGRVQALLDLIGVPYTCSGVTASSLAMDKGRTLQFVKSIDIKIPTTVTIQKNKHITNDDIIKKVGLPCVVKPNNSGSSVAISIVNNKQELANAINVAYGEDSIVLIQEFIKGREFTCSVLGNANNHVKPLPIIEIVTDEEFFDYHAKYKSKKTQEIVNPQVGKAIIKQIQDFSLKIHNLLSCDGLTRSDFILSENNEIYFLEINTIPGLTKMSLTPKSSRAAGIEFSELIGNIIELSAEKERSTLSANR